MEGLKGKLKKFGIILGTIIDGAAYLSDKTGVLFGWIDIENEKIYISVRYAHWRYIIYVCTKLDFNFSDCEIKEKPVIDFYLKKRRMIIKMRNRRK